MGQPYVGNAKHTVNDRLGEAVGLLRENMKVARLARLTGGLLGSYTHHDGSVGVLVQVEGAQADPAVLRDVCMHIAATKPIAARREEVSADVVEREKEIARAQIANDPKNAGKPANILEKIAEGKLRTWMAETVLTEQPIANQVKYPKKSVGELLKAAKLEVVSFVRYKVGEQ
jgi:elongation factor Ts